jgi:hypothetical protein
MKENKLDFLLAQLGATETLTVDDKIKQLLEFFKESYPTSVCGPDLSIESKLPWNIVTLIDLLFCRIYDLAFSAHKLYLEEGVIPPIILTRSAFEVASIMFNTHRKLDNAFETRDTDAIKDFVQKMLFGSKGEEVGVEAINILTHVDSMDKWVNGAKDMYGQLSGYVHGSYPGLMSAYCTNDVDTYTTVFRPEKKDIEYHVGLGKMLLLNSILIFMNFYFSALDNMEAIISLK